MNRLFKDEHSSLFVQSVNDTQKSFIRLTPSLIDCWFWHLSNWKDPAQWSNCLHNQNKNFQFRTLLKPCIDNQALIDCLLALHNLPTLCWRSSYLAAHHHRAVVPQFGAKDQLYDTVYQVRCCYLDMLFHRHAFRSTTIRSTLDRLVIVDLMTLLDKSLHRHLIVIT